MYVEVFKVDQDGKVVDNLLMLEEEIEENDDPFLIPFGWSDKQLYMAVFDFDSNEWVEGMSDQEIAEIQFQVEKENSRMSIDEMNAIAIMELATIVLEGGK